LVVPVLCDGILEPGAGGEVRASQPATVASLPVADGARVSAGDVLLTLSNPEIAQRARDARSAAAGLSAELAATRSEADSLADNAFRRVRIRIDEPDLPRIAPGQLLTLTFDGLPGQSWAGRVMEVSPALREEGGRRVGDVGGVIEDRGALLPGNASVNVSVVT